MDIDFSALFAGTHLHAVCARERERERDEAFARLHV